MASRIFAAVLILGASPLAQGAPAAPDYSQADAWAAWPGRASGADAVPPGIIAAQLPDAVKADVFFIHPTTYLSGGPANARYDEPGVTSAQIDRGVLRFQASVFNACCRIYAPHYRQASLHAFMGASDAAAQSAFELAYADVQRAFEYYLEHENRGRPFLIASHSQGSLHALRLLQERIMGRAAQRQLVVAYVIGYDIPLAVEQRGISLCRSPSQTGCLIDWNTYKEGASDEARQEHRLVWIDGRYQHLSGRPLVCVNPLTWTLGGEAAAELNLGALPGTRQVQLLPPVAGLTGARCEEGVLRVQIPWSKRQGFSDLLTLFGSYHVFDYNLFYSNIRVNARDRIVAYRAAHPG
jgi:hypothetical protein